MQNAPGSWGSCDSDRFFLLLLHHFGETLCSKLGSEVETDIAWTPEGYEMTWAEWGLIVVGEGIWGAGFLVGLWSELPANTQRWRTWTYRLAQMWSRMGRRSWGSWTAVNSHPSKTEPDSIWHQFPPSFKFVCSPE